MFAITVAPSDGLAPQPWRLDNSDTARPRDVLPASIGRRATSSVGARPSAGRRAPTRFNSAASCVSSCRAGWRGPAHRAPSAASDGGEPGPRSAADCVPGSPSTHRPNTPTERGGLTRPGRRRSPPGTRCDGCSSTLLDNLGATPAEIFPIIAAPNLPPAGLSALRTNDYLLGSSAARQLGSSAARQLGSWAAKAPADVATTAIRVLTDASFGGPCLSMATCDSRDGHSPRRPADWCAPVAGNRGVCEVRVTPRLRSSSSSPRPL